MSLRHFSRKLHVTRTDITRPTIFSGVRDIYTTEVGLVLPANLCSLMSQNDLNHDTPQKSTLAAKTALNAACLQPAKGLKRHIYHHMSEDPVSGLLRCLKCLEKDITPKRSDCQMCQEAFDLEEKRIEEALDAFRAGERKPFVVGHGVGASQTTYGKTVLTSKKPVRKDWKRLVTTYDTSSSKPKEGWRQATITTRDTSNFIDLTQWLESNPESVTQPIGRLEEGPKRKPSLTVKRPRLEWTGHGSTGLRQPRGKELTSAPYGKRVKLEPPSGSYSSTTPTRLPNTHDS